MKSFLDKQNIANSPTDICVLLSLSHSLSVSLCLVASGAFGSGNCYAISFNAQHAMWQGTGAAAEGGGDGGRS